MTLSISVALNDARLQGTLDFLNVGTGVARLRLYDGTRPANGGTPTTLLVEIPLDDPAGAITAHTLVLAASTLPLVATSGVATWGRMVNGNGDHAFDATVTDTAGSGEIKIPSTTLFAGGKTQLVSGVLG